MPTIGWTEGVPSGTSTVDSAPNLLRSLWTSLAIGLGTDLYWPGSGGGSEQSLGDLRPGGSRTYFAAKSLSSNSNDARNRARAFFASDTSQLFVYGSNGTYCVGTPFLIEHATSSGSGVWVVQSGSTLVPSAGNPTSLSFFFPQQFVDAPVVAHITLSERSFLYGVPVVTNAVLFSSFSYLGPGAQSAFTLYWRAIGRISGATI